MVMIIIRSQALVVCSLFLTPTSSTPRMSKPNRVTCYCSSCGGPSGPGSLLAYSTWRRHARLDLPEISPAFYESLRSIAPSSILSGPSIVPASSSIVLASSSIVLASSSIVPAGASASALSGTSAASSSSVAPSPSHVSDPFRPKAPEGSASGPSVQPHQILGDNQDGYQDGVRAFVPFCTVYSH
jgi:hypothetical protein